MIALRCFVLGVRGFPGALRLAGLRVVALFVCLVPARVLGGQEMQEVLAGHPSGEGPLSFEVFQLLLKEAGGPFLAAAAVGALAFLLLDQLLTAAAISLVDGGGRAQVWASVWTTGWDNLLRLVRILVAAALAHVVILIAAAKVIEALGRLGERSGWTGLTGVVVMPAAVATFAGVLLAGVGAWALFARVLVVTDGRRNALRALLDSARALLRAPSLPMVFAAATLGLHLVGGVVVVGLGWPPADGGGAVTVSLLLVIPQAWMWITCVGAFRHAYAEGPFEHVRATVDAPLPLIGRLTRHLG